MLTPVEILNRRLRDSLGSVCGGALPRFAWKYAPEQPYFVYDRDNRTLLKKTWADAPAPDGGTLGKVWLLAEWRVHQTFDHFGFQDGVRIPSVHAAGYSPYIETALAPGQEPGAELTANYVYALDVQLRNSAEHKEDSFENYMAEEKWTADKNKRKDQADWRETAAAGYDEHTGAFGNLRPGDRGGWMSFQNVEH